MSFTLIDHFVEMANKFDEVDDEVDDKVIDKVPNFAVLGQAVAKSMPLFMCADEAIIHL